MMAVAQRLDRRLDDMRRCWKIRLTDAEIDDVAPGLLKLRRAREYGKGILFAHAGKGLDDRRAGACRYGDIHPERPRPVARQVIAPSVEPAG